MTHRTGEFRQSGVVPKGHVADHWTWRDGVPHVTGTHAKPKRGEQQMEPGSSPTVKRGTLFERMAAVARGEVQTMSKNTGPSKRKLRLAASPKPASRAKQLKASQGSLL
jgi:hypothetical protein